MNNKEKSYFSESKLLLALIIFLIGVGFSAEVNAAASPAMAEESLKRSQNILSFMHAHNLSTDRLLDLFKEGQLYFDERDYEAVIEVEARMQQLKEDAFEIKNRINEVYGIVTLAEELGYASNETIMQLQESKEAFLIGNYEFADRMLQEVEFVLSGFLLNQLESVHELTRDLENQSQELELNVGSEIATEVQNAIAVKDISAVKTLYTNVLSLNESIPVIRDAKESLEKAQQDNFSTVRMKDSYVEAKIALELRLFEKATSEASSVIQQYTNAQEVHAAISKTHERVIQLQEDGVFAGKAENDLEKAVEAFEDEDYEQSREFIVAAEEELTKIQTASLLSNILTKEQTNRTVSLIKKFWYIALFGFVAFGFLCFFSYLFLQRRLLLYKLSQLQKEEPALIELMKKDQIEYFKKKTMSKETYENRMDKHHERLLYVREALPEIKLRIKKMKRGTGSIRKALFDKNK